MNSITTSRENLSEIFGILGLDMINLLILVAAGIFRDQGTGFSSHCESINVMKRTLDQA